MEVDIAADDRSTQSKPQQGGLRPWMRDLVAHDLPSLYLIGIVVLVSVAGAWVAYDAVAGPGVPSSSTAVQVPVGKDAPTSFGAFIVTRVEFVKPTTAKALGGRTHGLQGYVPPDRQQVTVSVTFSNNTDRTVDYNPKQVAMRVAGGKGKEGVVDHSSATILPGVLQPFASIDASFSFVVPRARQLLTVQFDDADGRQVTVPVGRSGDPVKAESNAKSKDHH